MRGLRIVAVAVVVAVAGRAGAGRPAADTGRKVVGAQPPGAGDWPMFGGTPARNMVSPGLGPPTDWDVATGRNVKWSARLGSQSYGPPVVAGGVVYVGTNNEARFDPAHPKDGGVLLALDEATGKVLWQRYVPKLRAGRVNDWPFQGQCGAPLVEPGRLWYATSRCEMVCLDVRRTDRPPPVMWSADMLNGLGVFPHNMTRSHLVAWDDLVYVVTGNGVDEGHRNAPAPGAPAVVCFDKNTGAVVWSDNSPGRHILHGQWGSPAVAEVDGRALVIAPLGDGWVYAFAARTGEVVWKFDANGKGTTYPQTRNELLATPVVYRDRVYIAAGQDPEHGEGPGHIWCVRITGRGDVSLELDAGEADPPPGKPDPSFRRPGDKPRKGRPNPNSAVVWHFEKFDADGDGRVRRGERMNRSLATVAIADGLVFAADFSGYLHCFDAETGRHCWWHDMEAAMWEGPLVVDGKVYVADEDGDVEVLKVSRERQTMASLSVGTSIYCAPVYANGTLYVMAKDRLFALRQSP